MQKERERKRERERERRREREIERVGGRLSKKSRHTEIPKVRLAATLWSGGMHISAETECVTRFTYRHNGKRCSKVSSLIVYDYSILMRKRIGGSQGKYKPHDGKTKLMK